MPEPADPLACASLFKVLRTCNHRHLICVLLMIGKHLVTEIAHTDVVEKAFLQRPELRINKTLRGVMGWFACYGLSMFDTGRQSNHGNYNQGN